MVAAFEDAGLLWDLPGVWLLDDNAHRSECRSCHAPVVWARHAVSGKRSPFDPIAADAPTGTLSVSHFATCPNASTWRKSR